MQLKMQPYIHKEGVFNELLNHVDTSSKKSKGWKLGCLNQKFSFVQKYEERP